MTIQTLLDAYNDYTYREFGDSPISLAHLRDDSADGLCGVLELVYTEVGTVEDREIWVSYDTDDECLRVDLYDAPMVEIPMTYQQVADNLDWDNLLNLGLTALDEKGIEVR